MTDYAIIHDGTPAALTPGSPFRDGHGTLHPWSVIRAWPDQERAEIGVYRIVTVPVPHGYRSTGSTLTWDGETVTRTHTIEPLPVDLPALKVALKAGIDEQAEAERSRYITPGSGQALTYKAKAEEALAFLADPSPHPPDYPLLSAEVGVTGETLGHVAQVVAHMHAQWQIVGGAIERARLAAKAAIDAAEDEASARSVVPTWP